MDLSHKINWQNEESSLLLNPRLPEQEKKELQELARLYSRPGHIWIASSGSSTRIEESVKLSALSKKAFLASAKAVNQHLRASALDVWIQALPRFHVGGLSIEARSFLSGSQIVSGLEEEKWNPHFFYQSLLQHKGTLTSLVSTQVFDLVQAGLRPPTSLRAVVVGGSALTSETYERAVALGWPLLQSYGMTECCSQVATAALESWKNQDPQLQLLSHIEAQTSEKGFLRIKSPSLLTGYAQWRNGQNYWEDPKVDDWYQTQDLCEIKNGCLIPLGRGSDFIKVHGEGVHLQKLQSVLDPISQKILSSFWQEVAVVGIPDERAQNLIGIVSTSQILQTELEKVVEEFNRTVAPFEKIQVIKRVEKIPRNELGKIAREKLKSLI